MPKFAFTDFANDNYETPETIERMVDTFGWPEVVAVKYAHSHKPMYEVRGEFEYDPETNELTVVAAVINGVRLVPE